MIIGTVSADREAIIRLAVGVAGGQQQEVDAVIDTGFDGWLSLPPALIAQWGLAWRSRGRALLADGTDRVFDIHEGIVIWDGQPRRIPVDAADVEPLVGMSLLEGYELTIQVRPYGQVAIKALP